METTERIPSTIAVIETAWKAHPELRLGQLLINALNPRDLTELYYLQDRALAARIVARADRQDPATGNS
jgi:hypothetical protein